MCDLDRTREFYHILEVKSSVHETFNSLKKGRAHFVHVIPNFWDLCRPFLLSVHILLLFGSAEQYSPDYPIIF